MKMKAFLYIFLGGFILLCTLLVNQSGLFEQPQVDTRSPLISLKSDSTAAGNTDNTQIPENIEDTGKFSGYIAINDSLETVQIGSVDPESGYKFEVILTSRGAAIKQARLSEYDDRDPKNPKPLTILSPVETQSQKIYSLANDTFKLNKKQIALSRLDWELLSTDKKTDGKQSVTFQAVLRKKYLTDAEGKKVYIDTARLTKTYTIKPDSYEIQVDLNIENLSDNTIESSFLVQGPTGIHREGSRQDMRDVITAYLLDDGRVQSTKRDQRKLRKIVKSNDKGELDMRIDTPSADFIWSAISSKYFAAIARPVPNQDQAYPEYIKFSGAQYFDPGLTADKPNGDENISFLMTVKNANLAPAGTENDSKSYQFNVFLGPKIKELFEENPVYNKLGYIQTVSFMACFCCPEAIINPLSFGIMALMTTMHTFLFNYGIVIIVLVLLIRIILHPITKKSQVSMMKMQKIAGDPEMQGIKKKYANNRQELHKATMEFYRERNLSPAAGMLGMLPMMLQMPIWIALYRAIYANIELRGAGFLPFWITDLSVPDALIPFANPIVIPLVGWHIDSFNLLPVLLGVAMFLQQKLMPHQSSQNTDPQVAQQQKMMMFMMPFMMLIFLYTAPSGLNLYIMASTFGGVLEQTVIRKHIREKEAEESQGRVAVTRKTGGKPKKKKTKPFYKQ